MAKFKILVTLLSAVSTSFFVANYSFASLGITGYSGNPAVSAGPVCNTCHGLPPKPGIAPDVSIEGPILVAKNTRYTYKIRMTGGQKNLGALNVSVDSGKLFKIDPNTSVDVNTLEIKQLTEKNVMLDNSTITWIFEWTSPDVAGTSTLYASLLSADGDSTVDNDKSSKLSLVVEVVDPAVTTVPVIENAKVKIVSKFRAVIGDKVQFFAVKTPDSPAGSLIKDYTWTASIQGKNVVKNGQQVEFSFDQIRIYTITLDTTFGNGNTGTTFFDIEIGDIGKKKFLIPTAKITPPGTIVVGTEVTFSGAASIPTTVNQYYWDFGDNTPDPSPNATSQIKHTFTTTGKHTVTLAVQDLDTNGGFTGIDVIEIDVVDSATGGGGGPAAVTGLSLYDGNCLSCHGIAGAGSTAKIIKGATEVLIDRTLINGVHPAVTVTPAGATNTQLIASYLGSGAVVTDGLSLYTTKCLICHGADGVGVAGLGKRVDGAANTTIDRAINNQNIGAIPPPISLMKGIELTPAQSTLISGYLATVVPIANVLSGQAKFSSNCQMCHGTAEGGQAISITTATEAMISTAILNIPSMNSRLAGLSLFDKNEIELYLLGPTYIPRPTTGAALFEMYCSYCHGATGQAGINTVAQKSINGKRYDEKRIRDSYGENGISIMRKSNLPNVNFTKTERQSMAIFLDPTVANGGN